MDTQSEKDLIPNWVAGERELYLEQVKDAMSKVATISKALLRIDADGKAITAIRVKVHEYDIGGLRDDLRNIAIDRINQLVRLSRVGSTLGHDVYPHAAVVIEETLNDAYFFSAMTVDGISEWLWRPQNSLTGVREKA